MTKLIVVAMILAAALVVTPVAARNVASGENIFVGEENVILDTAVGGFAGVNQLVHYTGTVGASSIDKTLSVDAAGKVETLEKGIPTGSYYGQVPGSAVTGASPYVNVYNPELTLDVVLDDASRKDSVNGKSVTRDTKLAFKVKSNVDTYVAGTYMNDNVSIELTLPGGGVVTDFGGQPLKYNADGSTKFIAPIDLSKAEAGTYTAVGKWARTSDFFGKGYDSKPVTFEVLTKALAITANKDSVVRGNSFTVTITAESRTDYILSVKSGDAKSPLIAPGQTAVNYTVAGETDWNRTVKTNAGGTATIQFNTSLNTDDKTFTIRVEDPDPKSDKNDEVKVKVEAGSVTITASGTGTYYIGEELTLSGTSTEGDKVFFFLTGPNLASDGVDLVNLAKVSTTDPDSFTTADVNADDTWSKKWNTAGLAIDAGSYTVYAVSTNASKADLSDAKYSTASISLRSGYITATTSGATVAKGDKLTISGTAQGNPDDVYIWIFGKNYYGTPNSRALNAEKVSVESDGSFEHELKSADTKDLAAGQYFVVVQHPMGDNPGVKYDPNGVIYGDGINNVTLTSLQAPAAATALIDALDSPNIPDTYVKLTFVVEEPQLFIDPIGDKAAGSKFTISGTTNLAVGNTLNIDVTSAAFQPGQKTEASAFSGFGGSAVVQKGDGMNTWSFEVDGTSFKVDQYIVTVESIDAGKTATALFNVVEKEEATPTAEVTTTAPAGEVTTTAPAGEATTEATPTPGFGALVALLVLVQLPSWSCAGSNPN
ncbi:MEMAR_RS02690 family S-layer glycoprotein [Methanoculleus bourgensis]|nr:MEMAR_RS02690 family S-layer glycoprotein [Methanoculleus bourgensis]